MCQVKIYSNHQERQSEPWRRVLILRNKAINYPELNPNSCVVYRRHECLIVGENPARSFNARTLVIILTKIVGFFTKKL